uniref:[histone H3]-lysine(4) N-methyltransferase n=1 Tax=Anolis carolinensis TaxID=28377 RepID=H9GNH0_ANOCA|nr:PREDICTED: histone-lysine N-methyltransferase 2B [Anolis carolinensis]|eukprot:XP_008115314.1 PREDICTED: histone-lysine N-methyltransferase 2B [Anolis carolinensis]
MQRGLLLGLGCHGNISGKTWRVARAGRRGREPRAGLSAGAAAAAVGGGRGGRAGRGCGGDGGGRHLPWAACWASAAGGDGSQRLLGSVGGGSGSSSSEDEPEEFLGFHLEDEVTQSSRRAALRSKRGTALPVRKKERKKRAATEDTPPKRLVKQKAVESQRERMVKALAELLQKSKRSPARIGRPPISGPKVGRKLPKQTKQGPEPDDSIKSTISPTLSSQIEKTINSIVSPRPRGRPPGSSRKRLVTEAESPCESTKAPSSIPEPSISPQSSSPSSQPPEDLKKPPLILKFFSKARRHKSGQLVVTHVRLKTPGHRRGRKRKWSVVPRKKMSPLPSQSVSESETPLSESEASAPEPEQKEESSASQTQPQEVLAPDPEPQPECVVPKPEPQPEVITQEPEQPPEVSLEPVAFEVEQQTPAQGADVPALLDEVSWKGESQEPCPEHDGTEGLSEEGSSSIAHSTRAQCLKRGRGRPPLTPTQRAQRMAIQQLPTKAKEEGLGAVQQSGNACQEEASTHKTNFLKNIRQFIMPVVSARSSRLIRTPRRFMDEIPQKTPKPTESPVTDGICLDKQESSQLPLQGVSPRVAHPEPVSPDEEISRVLSSPPSPSVPQITSPAAPALPEKRRSILREPTFRWTSLSPTSSPKDVGKTLFQLPCEDSSPLPSTPAPLPSPPAKRSPLLRAPQFTPSEAHLKIYESLTVSPEDSESVPASPEVRRDPPAPQHESPTLPYEPVVTRSGKKLLARVNHLALPLFTEVSSPPKTEGKELITMEDVNSPGVVHKVAIRRVLPPPIQVEQERTSDKPENKVEPASLIQKEQKSSDAPKPIITQLSSMDKVYSLLTRAKVQLYKIDQQKQFKFIPGCQSVRAGAFEIPKVPAEKTVTSDVKAEEEEEEEEEKEDRKDARNQGQESPVQGPRIKHVCRHASVALGQSRAMVPEDVPRLSALPLREREEITVSPTVEETSSASESESGLQKQVKVETSIKTVPPPVRRHVSHHHGKKNRMTRCGRCKGCLKLQDCGECNNCLDKPKFGGPNTKKQCCVYRKCDKIEARRVERLSKKGRTVVKAIVPWDSEDSQEAFPAPLEVILGATETAEQDSLLQRKSARRCVKQRPSYDIFETSDSDTEAVSGSATHRRKSSRDSDLLPMDSEEQSRPRRTPLQPVVQLKARKKPEKDLTNSGTFRSFSNGWNGKQKSTDGIHRLRVDFKEDCDLENVWLMGGLSILASVPVTTQLVCLLCASKGFHQLVFCQVCCDPFHVFCLEDDEQPLPEQEESWCCRRCKFCHVCGRKNKASKQLLECERCRNCYHLACLGPNYPTKPFRKRKNWVCSACIRCKSCGTAPGKNWDTEWSNDYSLCSACSVLHDKGNYCPICLHCYEDNDYESKMMQCAKCDHWVHAKCEGLSDEGYEILSNLPESVVYACRPCCGSDKAKWREVLSVELRKGLRQVLQGLMSSKCATPLLQCAQCCPDDGVRVHLRPCDLCTVNKLFEQGHYSSVHSFNEDMVGVLLGQTEDQQNSLLAKALYIELMGKFFSWFDAQDEKHWIRNTTLPNGMLPNAVLPPSSDHIYAQWRQPEETNPVTKSHLTLSGPEKIAPKDADASPQEPLADSEDKRQCALCLQYGDAPSKDAGRLLYIGQNEWTHVNCAIWSAEVFEENDGSLKNVHAAVARGRQMRCEHCQRTGATVGCCLSACLSNYHFMCARLRQCTFQDDKKVFCQKHVDLLDGTEIVADDGFDVLRRVYVDFEGISFKRKFMVGLEPDIINMMIGSMKIDSLGMLTDLSECEGRLFPVGYQCSRMYWSTVDAHRRCWYKCRVLEYRPKQSQEEPDASGVQEENHTIVHSPTVPADSSIEEKHLKDVSTSMPPPEHHSPIQNPGSLPHPEAAVTKPKSLTGARIKVPNYSPTRRPISGVSSRPLPSPGSASSMSHHILTVGDPDFPPPRRTQRLSPLSPSSAHRTHRSSFPPQTMANRTSPASTSLRAMPLLPDNPTTGNGFRQNSTSDGQRPSLTSPPPSPPPVPPELAFELNVSDLEFDDSLLDEPFQEEELGVTRMCPSSPGLGLPQLDGLGDAESEEEGEESRYFRFPRTVVTRESPLPPYPLDLPLPHINQLDGIDDGTDSEADSAGGHPSAKGKQAEPRVERELAGPAPAPEDLPSDIVDFVLKNMDTPESKAPLPSCLNQMPMPPAPATSTSFNGTESAHPTPAPDLTPTLTLSCAQVPGAPEVRMLGPEGQKPGSRIILVNKLGQVCVKVQSEEDILNSQDGEQASSCDAKPNSIPAPLPAPTPAPSLGTVILRAPLGLNPNPLPTWTIRGPVISMVPMVNVVGTTPQALGGGQLALSAPALVTPSLGLQQTCLLQPVTMNSGVLSIPGLVSLPGPRPAIRVKRVSTFVGNVPVKKVKMDGVNEEEPLPMSPTATPDHLTNNCISGSTVASGIGRVRMKTPTTKGVLDLDALKEEADVSGSDHSPMEHCPSLVPLHSHPGSPEQNQELLLEPAWHRYAGELSSSDEDNQHLEDKENEIPRKTQPHLCFEITNEDGLNVQAATIDGAWKAVIEKVQEARTNARLKHLSFAGMNGVRMLGMHHDAVIFLVEQLYGAKACHKYKFRYHQHEGEEEELPLNPHGCARAEVYSRKCTFDMFNFLASQHRVLPEGGPYDEEEDEVQLKSTRRATSLELPMAMRFRHLKKTSKEAVGVYRSAIHGRGLFCKRNIDAGEMVIEYSGIVIRSVLTDKREKYYDSKGIGCYMFRIDDFDVVDATMHGNAARFINHSCEPNCYSRVIHVEGQKHIVIFALRRIFRGEELTYDYKFPIEDAGSKLPCNCGAKRCRRFLN